MSAARGTPVPDAAATELAGWIESVVGAAGYDLEELVVTPAGRRTVVRVVIDRDSGVTLDDVAEVSRAVSVALDDKDGDMGRTPYVLEVTSPGVGRPLSAHRHWRRNIGRLVSVAVGPVGQPEQVTGRIVAVDDDGVTLTVAQPKKATVQRRLDWAELGAGRVQVEFGSGKRHAADDAGPDPAGADPEDAASHGPDRAPRTTRQPRGGEQ